ncbi:hypothetical protein CASFOL_035978 [Castilleja foliolosa]|uniref:Uncharacterized protein n=1 Tax=Castilleja foliolosa TaxID=1961234 RepID=A0ABD3BU99_9LAMI
MNCMYANQEYSSGCESGWTLYLEHSSISSYNQENHVFNKNEVAERLNEEDDDVDEDLSMVSDASSGPAHLHEEETNTNGCFYNYPIIDDPSCKKGKKNMDKKRRRYAQDQQSSLLLDDTASSAPFFDSSDKSLSLTIGGQTMVENNNELEYSQGYSSTQFEVRPPYQEQYDLFLCNEPGNQLQQSHGLKAKGGDTDTMSFEVFLEGQKWKVDLEKLEKKERKKIV